MAGRSILTGACRSGLGVLVCLALWAPVYAAARPKPRAPKAAPKAPVSPAASETAPALAPNLTSEQLIAQARQLYADLAYDEVLTVVHRLLGNRDLPKAIRMEAYQLEGSCVAVVRDPIDAEDPFRKLLRLAPDFDLPPSTPPKILAVFRKVQVEEKALAAQLNAAARAKVTAGLELQGDNPRAGTGGQPIVFNYRLRDPTNAVDNVRVGFRREGQPFFSALVLHRDDDGEWRGEIPGQTTAGPVGYKLEYFIETNDSQGPLLRVGSDAAPISIDIAPGVVALEKPPPLPRWAFFLSTGLTAGAGVAAGYFGYAREKAQKDFGTLETQARTTQVSADRFLDVESRGKTYARNTNIALGCTIGFAVLSAVAFPFTDFDGP